jgi:hypothetical protein
LYSSCQQIYSYTVVVAAALETALVLALSINLLLVNLFRLFSKELLVLRARRGVSVRVTFTTKAKCVYLSSYRLLFYYILVVNMCSGINVRQCY